MRGKMLRVEPLERRDLLAALWSGSNAEPVQAHECVQVQECGVECPGPVQEQTQTQEQTQLQQQGGAGPGPVEEPLQEQTQNQVQQQDGTGPGPVEEPLQEQTQNQVQQRDGTGPGPVQDQTQERTRLQQHGSAGDQDRDRNQDCTVNDAAIESLVADDTDPPRERTGVETQPETGICQRDRDRTSW